MSTEQSTDNPNGQPLLGLGSSEGLGAAGAPVFAEQMLRALLRGPFVPKAPDAEKGDKGDESDDGYTNILLRHEAAKSAISAAVHARLAAGVRGTTKDGKLQAIRHELTSIVRAYVVERRGKGLLVQADDVQVWLPAYKVNVLSASEIRIPDWLLRQRAGQFHIDDRRELEPWPLAPRPLSWNSADGEL